MQRQKADSESSPKPLSLRSRTLVFALLLTASSVVGMVILLQAQENLSLASSRIRDHYLPTARLLDRARNEINFQLQELGYLIGGLKKEGDEGVSSSQKLSRLRPTPAVRALASLYHSGLLPSELREHFTPWAEKLKDYETDYPQTKEFSRTLLHLREFKNRTDLLQRAVDRELSLLILQNQEKSRLYTVFWALAFSLGLLATLVYTFLVWQWMKPLEDVTYWLERENFDFPPKASPLGWLRPPLEVEELVQKLRKVIYKFSEQGRMLEDKTQLVDENERSAQILLSGYLALMKHNEELTQEYLKREKLASMGEMAAELAHEIRNPLNGMNLKLELLKSELDAPQQRVVDKIIQEIDRLDALTESHLRTARTRVIPQQNKSLAEVIRRTLEDFDERLKQADIHCHFVLDDSLQLGSLPENILKAVLVNLLKNAIEAIEEWQQNPERSVREGLIVLEAKRSDRAWIIGIHDTGMGFPPELLGRPLQSFNTTKEQGSGLGLATAQKMLDAYGVQLKIVSPNPPYATSVFLTGKLEVLPQVDAPSFIEKPTPIG